MPYPPNDYHICPCCGTEFGNDDADLTHEQLRKQWIANGRHWFYGNPPMGWNPWLQLIEGGQLDLVPFRAISAPSAGVSSKTLHAVRAPLLQVC